MGVEAFGVDDRELGEGGFPTGRCLTLDEFAGCGTGPALESVGLFGAFAGLFVLDVHARQPEQLHRGGVVGEVPAVPG